MNVRRTVSGYTTVRVRLAIALMATVVWGYLPWRLPISLAPLLLWLVVVVMIAMVTVNYARRFAALRKNRLYYRQTISERRELERIIIQMGKSGIRRTADGVFLIICRYQQMRGGRCYYPLLLRVSYVEYITLSADAIVDPVLKLVSAEAFAFMGPVDPVIYEKGGRIPYMTAWTADGVEVSEGLYMGPVLDLREQKERERQGSTFASRDQLSELLEQLKSARFFVR